MKWFVQVVMLLLFTGCNAQVQNNDLAQKTLFELKKIETKLQVGISYNEYISMIGDLNFYVTSFLESPQAKKNIDFSELIRLIYQSYYLAIDQWKYSKTTLYIEGEGSSFDLFASNFPDLIKNFEDDNNLRYVAPMDIVQKYWQIASAYIKFANEILQTGSVSKEKKNNFQREKGVWKVQKFKTSKTGKAGAYFDGENIKILIYKKPEAHHISIKLILQGDQKLLKENNMIIFFFDGFLPPMPIKEYSNFQVDFRYWNTLKPFTIRNTQMTTATLSASELNIDKIKKSNELFIMGGSEIDISNRKGYAIRYRISLKNFAKVIDEALSM